MRPEGNNPLDLNNLPEEYHGKQPVEESSTTTAASAENSTNKGFKKKKKEGKDESGKVYECRFCSLKFCKSQALGGHMNRHRQERETETLNRARQLVFNNDSIAGVGPHIGLRDLSFGGAAAPSGCYQQIGSTMGVDQRLHFRPTTTAAGAVYPRHPTAPPQSHQHLQQPYLYSPHPYQATYPPPAAPPAPAPAPPPPAVPPLSTDYYIGHVVPGSSSHQVPNYNCFGPPPSSTFHSEGARPITDGGNWGCSLRFGQNAGPSSIERFRDHDSSL